MLIIIPILYTFIVFRIKVARWNVECRGDLGMQKCSWLPYWPVHFISHLDKTQDGSFMLPHGGMGISLSFYDQVCWWGKGEGALKKCDIAYNKLVSNLNQVKTHECVKWNIYLATFDISMGLLLSWRPCCMCTYIPLIVCLHIPYRMLQSTQTFVGLRNIVGNLCVQWSANACWMGPRCSYCCENSHRVICFQTACLQNEPPTPACKFHEPFAVV